MGAGTVPLLPSTCSFRKSLLNSYYVPSLIPRAWDPSVNKQTTTESLLPWHLQKETTTKVMNR